MVMYLRKMCLQKKCTKMFIAALFIIAPNWNKILTILKIFSTFHLFGVIIRILYPEGERTIP